MLGALFASRIEQAMALKDVLYLFAIGTSAKFRYVLCHKAWTLIVLLGIVLFKP